MVREGLFSVEKRRAQKREEQEVLAIVCADYPDPDLGAELGRTTRFVCGL